MDIISQGDFAVTHSDGKTTFTFRLPSVDKLDFVKNSQVITHTAAETATNAITVRKRLAEMNLVRVEVVRNTSIVAGKSNEAAHPNSLHLLLSRLCLYDQGCLFS